MTRTELLRAVAVLAAEPVSLQQATRLVDEVVERGDAALDELADAIPRARLALPRLTVALDCLADRHRRRAGEAA